MTKNIKIGFGILFVSLLVAISGCDLLQKDKDEATEFKRGSEGLAMEFVKNYPGDSYLLSDRNEEISIIIDIRNKGTYPEGVHFDEGNISLSGFDDGIIRIGKCQEGEEADGKCADEFWVYEKSKKLSEMFLPAASPINPLGGFDTAEFDGEIVIDKITVDRYDPTILATVCYPYVTKSSPTVCIDPRPFDDREGKVCQIGSTTVPSQGAPVAVTKIDQEASTSKIQFKINIKNVGNGDVIKPGLGVGDISTLRKCSPLEKKDIQDPKYRILDRKDFDRVQLEKVEIGPVNLMAKDPVTGKSKCSPFADGSDNIIRLFNGEGFVICTLDIKDLSSVQSAYTTPLNIELKYNYRSTISKQIQISKLTTVG